MASCSLPAALRVPIPARRAGRCFRAPGRIVSTAVTTAGGFVVARSDVAAMLAGSVRALVEKGYPAFLRRDGSVVEVVKRGGRWQRTDGPSLHPASLVIEILNETEPTQGEDQSP